MNKSFFLCALLFTISCGGGGGGEQEIAKMAVKGAVQNLQKAASTPSSFKAAITKFEVLKGEDDTSPVVLFDVADGTKDVGIIDLTEEDKELHTGDLTEEYFGTYTHVRVTLVAAGQVISYTVSGGEEEVVMEKGYIEFFQEVDNTDGGYENLPQAVIPRGDILLESSGAFEWFQIDDTKNTTTGATRDEVTPFVDANPSDAIQVLALAEELTIEGGQEYIINLNFDVADTFEYTDIDDDNVFEPTSDDHDGTLNGVSFNIKQPGISITAVLDTEK